MLNTKKHTIRKGQAILEYFLLFAVLGALGIVLLFDILPRISRAVQGTEEEEGYFGRVAEGIINADQP